MPLSCETQVLVIGAGPSGLACAITLTSLGVPVIIVDALSTPNVGSRAAVVHARSLEVLDTIGLAAPLIDIGIPSTGVECYGGAEKLMDVNFSELRNETRFPMMLLASQEDIERKFAERLAAKGVEVLRGKKAVGLEDGEKGAGMGIIFKNGDKVRAKYIVGADGSRSTVRRLADIDFTDPQTGTPYDAHPQTADMFFQVVLVDVTFTEPLPLSLPRDAPSWHLNDLVVLLPLQFPKGATSHSVLNSFWRLGIVVPPGASKPPHDLDINYVQHEMDARNPWRDVGERLIVASVVTKPTTYRIRSAVAKTFFKKIGAGNILLVGDAAHVHSPTGAQGMNLGICDAVELGRAIHKDATVNSLADIGIGGDGSLFHDIRLETSHLLEYSSSRREIAITVVRITKRITGVITLTGWRRTVRNIILRILGRLRFVRRMAAWRLSGLVYRGR